MQKASKIKVDFNREGKGYSAIFKVLREESGNTYSLHARVIDDEGNEIFEKERHDLDYSQVEHALIFVFHQAFVEEEV